LIEKEVHPTVIIDGYRKAALKSLEVLDEIAVSVDPKDRDVLTQVAKTSLASKLVSEEADTLAKMAVDAVLKVLEETDGKYAVDLDNIKVEKKEGQSIDDTRLIDGIVLDKEVVHPDMPKLMEKPKIALLDVSLEIEKTEFDAKINVESPEQMKAFLKQEEDTLKSMVDKIESSGANLVLCQKGIDDLVQHFLARKQIMAVRRIKKSDMDKLALATGGRSVSRIDDLSSKDLGTAKLVEERRVGEDKMVFVEGCKNPKSVTMLVRGGTQRIVDEAERSIHDALSVVRDVVVDGKLVAGGGAPEAELSLRLGDYATSLAGKEQLAVQLFAKAIETIPSQLAENAGMDPIETMVELMAKHKGGKKWAGINVYDGKIVDMYKLKVLEPVVVKKQAIKSSVEAASMILKIDDIIAAGKMGEGPGGKGVGEGGEEGEE